MASTYAVLVAALLATVGWIFTARRNWQLSRKQHTINVILQANLSQEYLSNRAKVAPMIKRGSCDVGVLDGTDGSLEISLRRVLNHSEFVAAAIRNGDFDERLMRDAEQASYVQLFKVCQPYIEKLRRERQRATLYEHLEWLSARWTTDGPKWPVTWWEWINGRPVYGQSKRNQR